MTPPRESPRPFAESRRPSRDPAMQTCVFPRPRPRHRWSFRRRTKIHSGAAENMLPSQRCRQRSFVASTRGGSHSGPKRVQPFPSEERRPLRNSSTWMPSSTVTSYRSQNINQTTVLTGPRYLFLLLSSSVHIPCARQMQHSSARRFPRDLFLSRLRRKSRIRWKRERDIPETRHD